MHLLKELQPHHAVANDNNLLFGPSRRGAVLRARLSGLTHARGGLARAAHLSDKPGKQNSVRGVDKQRNT